MSDDFYVAVATVLPVLLLALIWDSRAIDNIRHEERQLRSQHHRDGVLFWTKRRVRWYTLVVSTVIVVTIGLCVLELGGAVPNGRPLRSVVIAAVVLTLGTLITRIWVDVIAATVEGPRPAVRQAASYAATETDGPQITPVIPGR